VVAVDGCRLGSVGPRFEAGIRAASPFQGLRINSSTVAGQFSTTMVLARHFLDEPAIRSTENASHDR